MSRNFYINIKLNLLSLISNGIGNDSVKGRAAVHAYKLLSKSTDKYTVHHNNEVTNKSFDITISAPYDNLYGELLILGTIEKGTVNFLKSFIKDGDVVFDIGANIGFYSLLFETSGTNTKIYSFEPMPDTFERLKQNVALNSKQKNININNIALVDSDSNLTIYLFKELHHGYSSISSQGRKDAIGFDIQGTSLDNYIFKNGISSLDFMKIDVEGAEKKVLEGAKDSISKFKPSVLMEMNFETCRTSGYKCSELTDMLLSFNDYDLYRFPSAKGNLTKMKDKTDFQHGDNVLFVSNKHKDRIKTNNCVR